MVKVLAETSAKFAPMRLAGVRGPGHLEKDCYIKYSHKKPKWLKLREEEFKYRRQLKAQKKVGE